MVNGLSEAFLWWNPYISTEGPEPHHWWRKKYLFLNWPCVFTKAWSASTARTSTTCLVSFVVPTFPPTAFRTLCTVQKVSVTDACSQSTCANAFLSLWGTLGAVCILILVQEHAHVGPEPRPEGGQWSVHKAWGECVTAHDPYSEEASFEVFLAHADAGWTRARKSFATLRVFFNETICTVVIVVIWLGSSLILVPTFYFTKWRHFLG